MCKLCIPLSTGWCVPATQSSLRHLDSGGSKFAEGELLLLGPWPDPLTLNGFGELLPSPYSSSQAPALCSQDSIWGSMTTWVGIHTPASAVTTATHTQLGSPCSHTDCSVLKPWSILDQNPRCGWFCQMSGEHSTKQSAPPHLFPVWLAEQTLSTIIFFWASNKIKETMVSLYGILKQLSHI